MLIDPKFMKASNKIRCWIIKQSAPYETGSRLLLTANFKVT